MPHRDLESLKGAVRDLVEEISWRQDDFEEVNRVLDLPYGVAKNFGSRSGPVHLLLRHPMSVFEGLKHALVLCPHGWG